MGGTSDTSPPWGFRTKGAALEKPVEGGGAAAEQDDSDLAGPGGPNASVMLLLANGRLEDEAPQTAMPQFPNCRASGGCLTSAKTPLVVPGAVPTNADADDIDAGEYRNSGGTAGGDVHIPLFSARSDATEGEVGVEPGYPGAPCEGNTDATAGDEDDDGGDEGVVLTACSGMGLLSPISIPWDDPFAGCSAADSEDDAESLPVQPHPNKVVSAGGRGAGGTGGGNIPPIVCSCGAAIGGVGK